MRNKQARSDAVIKQRETKCDQGQITEVPHQKEVRSSWRQSTATVKLKEMKSPQTQGAEALKCDGLKPWANFPGMADIVFLFFFFS